jgi:predicted permease
MTLNLFAQLLPLYIIILLGYCGKRWLQLDEKAIAKLVIFLITPVVFFGFTARATFALDVLSLPFINFAAGAFVMFTAWRLHHAFGLKDARGNLSALGVGTGNTGYFGIPLFTALFGPHNLGVYVFLIMGSGFAEVTMGYYILSRGHFSIRDSLLRVVRLPIVYAGLAGILVSYLHVPIPDTISTMFDWFKGAYVVLGMLIIGCTLGGMKKLEFDFKYLCSTVLGRHLIWPLLIWPICYFGRNYFSPGAVQSFIVLALVPLAANQVAYANEANIHPEKAATAVMISTLLAPLVIGGLLPWLTLFR